MDAVEASTGSRPRYLDGPPCPEAVEHIREWFLSLHAARTAGGFGPNPITYEALAAWATLTHTRPTAWEIETLRALDAAVLSIPSDGQVPPALEAWFAAPASEWDTVAE